MSINGDIENFIANLLKNKFPDFDVESYPVNFENYHFTSPIGALLIKFVQTDFKEQSTVWNIIQESILVFDIIACYRGLSTYGEIHKYQQKIKDALIGAEIFGRKIFLVKEQFLKESSTDLYCKITCSIKTYSDDLNET